MGHLLPYMATTLPGECVPHTESTSASGSPPTPPPTLPPTLPATCINASSRSVLLVENHPSLLDLLQRHLKEMGYTVRTALNAEEGLRLYRDCAPFNVVLIDHRVPEGFDIAERNDYCCFQRNGARLAKAIRSIDPSQGIIMLAFDFWSVGDVPRPPELINVPFLVDIRAPRLRIALEKIEVDRAIKALTRADQLRLRQFAMFRVRGLGRAAGTRDWQDLLQEALYRTLIGATDARNGRHWNKKVDLVKHLAEAMRSIASSWKRQFTAEEANTYSVSELETCDSEGEPYSPLDHIASGHVLADDRLIDMDERDRIFATLRDDADASRVLEGWIDGLKKNEILTRYGLDEKTYAAAVRRIRLKFLGRRGGDNGV